MSAAEEAFNSFRQQYPDFDEAEIKKIVGTELYAVLTNTSVGSE